MKGRSIPLKSKKILHLLSSNTFSGAENVACQIIDLFKTEDADMAYCSPNGDIKNALIQKNINYLPINKMTYSEVKKIVNSYNPDIIHAHDYKASVIASMFYKKKLISHIHVNNVKMNKINLYSLLYLMCSKVYSKIIWVSDSALENHCFNNMLKKKSVVLYNVIDKRKIEEQCLQKQLNEKYDLIFLGRLTYQKNPIRLIKIISKLKEKKDDIKVAIVGNGEMYDEVVRVSNELNLYHNIKFYGYMNNPYPILKSSKMLILTSLFEGTPMCALEALALGIPVISTPVDGLKNIIKNDINGYLTNNDDEMCKKILEILSDDFDIESLSKNCQKSFEKISDLNKYKETIRDIYLE